MSFQLSNLIKLSHYDPNSSAAFSDVFCAACTRKGHHFENRHRSLAYIPIAYVDATFLHEIRLFVLCYETPYTDNYSYIIVFHTVDKASMHANSSWRGICSVVHHDISSDSSIALVRSSSNCHAHCNATELGDSHGAAQILACTQKSKSTASIQN